MQEDNKNKKSKFSGDAFSIVMSILLTITMNYANLYWGLIICVILPINIIIALFKDKRITKKNGLKTIIIILICSILIVVGEKWSEQNEIPENVERAELQIELSKLVLKYGDEHGIGELTAGISDDLVPEVIKFESYDYDVTINDYKIEDGKLIINQVPVGNCGIELKFQN